MTGMDESTAVLSLESNLGCAITHAASAAHTSLNTGSFAMHRFECQHIIHALKRAEIPRWLALNEGAGGGIGFLTTNQTKEASCFQLRDALRVGCIALSDEFFSNTLGEKDALNAMKDELERFSIVVEPPNTLFGKVRSRASRARRY